LFLRSSALRAALALSLANLEPDRRDGMVVFATRVGGPIQLTLSGGGRKEIRAVRSPERFKAIGATSGDEERSRSWVSGGGNGEDLRTSNTTSGKSWSVSAGSNEITFTHLGAAQMVRCDEHHVDPRQLCTSYGYNESRIPVIEAKSGRLVEVGLTYNSCLGTSSM
jgi:hypothetical protein